MGVLISKVAGLFLVYREVELTVFITAGLVWKRRVSGVEGRWLESGCDGFDRPRIAVFKFTTNKPPCLFFRCLLSCETSLLMLKIDILMSHTMDIRVFKIEERGRLEERHGRRGPGSNIRCSRSSAAGK